ncbi:MAG: PASTA domain-containing protein [Synergistaceae bacterium]|nr:PASTA domain-containing protein [Synergistaceae bacterium]MDD2350708.1 PASTA domain-containing protein [Synergistaceae bacterium]MDD3319011.1 PASTA domain-containing protein [Synergistaceae bacterium]MDD3672827.1 PASTA domain-containing protein [Synergistaceae bacterium]MDD3963619.1 PASTA domain-containing protein [Synergistaceae bacterium]
MGKVHRWGMVIAFIVIIASAYFGIKTVFIEDKSATVPNMVGLQLVDAVEALQKESLLAKVDQVDSPERADTVISQNLPAGERVSKGKVVIVRVSKGGSILPVPDVRGLKFEEGVKRLSEAGFKVDKIIRVADKLKPAGSIIAQNPAAPQQVAANCMVSLLVSSGGSGGSAFVNVPDLKGQAPDVVAQVLEQIGLTVGSRTETPSAEVPAGTVLRTNPRNGANVPAGTLINLTIARALKPGEASSETPPANDQDTQRAAAVRTVVVKNTEPSDIPTKLPENPATSPSQEPAKEEVKSEAEPVKAPEPAKPAPALNQKTAKLRYQVPPLTKPLSLKIELTDDTGTKVIKDVMANSSEYISMNVPFTGQATITIYLGGDFVWQDRFK